MKSLKIGKLIFNKKAILLILVCLFFNGVVIGAMVYYTQNTNQSPNAFLVMLMMFLPYFILRKHIRRNIEEMK